MADFKIGDTVCLKSGGPIMTVVDTDSYDGKIIVTCAWFPSDNEEKQANFPSEALQTA